MTTLLGICSCDLEGEASDDDEDLEGLLDEADVPIKELVSRYSEDEFKEFIQQRIDMGSLLREAAAQIEAEEDSEDDEEEDTDSSNNSDDSMEPNSDVESQEEIGDGSEDDGNDADSGSEKGTPEKQKSRKEPNVKLEHLSESGLDGEEVVQKKSKFSLDDLFRGTQ